MSIPVVDELWFDRIAMVQHGVFVCLDVAAATRMLVNQTDGCRSDETRPTDRMSTKPKHRQI